MLYLVFYVDSGDDMEKSNIVFASIENGSKVELLKIFCSSDDCGRYSYLPIGAVFCSHCGRRFTEKKIEVERVLAQLERSADELHAVAVKEHGHSGFLESLGVVFKNR